MGAPKEITFVHNGPDVIEAMENGVLVAFVTKMLFDEELTGVAKAISERAQISGITYV